MILFSHKKARTVIYAAVTMLVVALLLVSSYYTRLESGIRGGYTSTTTRHDLAKDKILYGRESFNMRGIAPIKIDKVEVINESGHPIEADVYIFFPLRQSAKMSGGEISREDFLTFYSENLISLDQLKWLNDQRFDVVIISNENRIENVWFDITYYVWGIFKKNVRSAEIVI